MTSLVASNWWSLRPSSATPPPGRCASPSRSRVCTRRPEPVVGLPMRQLTLLGPGEVEWIDVEEPVLHDIRDALVRPLAVGVCDVDPLLIAGAVPASYPIALGHEFIAEVVQAGPAAAVNVGDRVVAPYQVSCGDCEA